MARVGIVACVFILFSLAVADCKAIRGGSRTADVKKLNKMLHKMEEDINHIFEENPDCNGATPIASAKEFCQTSGFTFSDSSESSTASSSSPASPILTATRDDAHQITVPKTPESQACSLLVGFCQAFRKTTTTNSAVTSGNPATQVTQPGVPHSGGVVLVVGTTGTQAQEGGAKEGGQDSSPKGAEQGRGRGSEDLTPSGMDDSSLDDSSANMDWLGNNDL